VEIAGREVRTVRRMVQYIPPERNYWEIVSRNAPRIWRDFGSALPFQTRLTQTKAVLPLSNEHGSQVKEQCRRQCCHNKHKHFPIGLHMMYLHFPDTHRNMLYLTCRYLLSTVYSESPLGTDASKKIAFDIRDCTVWKLFWERDYLINCTVGSKRWHGLKWQAVRQHSLFFTLDET